MHGFILPDPGEPRFCGRCGQPLGSRGDGGRARPHCAPCGWTYYAKPALGAAALIEDDQGRILLVQRAGEPYKGWWTLPAGYVEYGEDAAETALREVEEETGLLVELTGYRGIYFGGGDPRGLGHLAIFGARPIGGALVAGDDAGDAQWFTRDAIPTNIAFEGHRKALERWRRERAEVASEPILLHYAGSGPAPPMLVYAIIENPVGSTQRIRYDEARHDFQVTDEVFPGPMPFHYGWVPRTLNSGGGSALAVAVVGEGAASVGAVLAVRPIGILQREGDPKIVAVRCDLPSAYTNLIDIGQDAALQAALAVPFASRGGEDGWGSAADARRTILDAQAAWIQQAPGTPRP